MHPRRLLQLYLSTLHHTSARQLNARLNERLYRASVRLRRTSAHHNLQRRAESLDLRLPAFHGKLNDRHAAVARHRLAHPPRAWHPENPRHLLFLNQSLPLGIPPTWKQEAVLHQAQDPALWLFHLHYFDWLWDLAAHGCEQIAIQSMLDWIDANPLGASGSFRAPWSSYTISRRLPNWILLLSLHRPTGDQRKIEKSILAQLLHLSEHLEWEHGANHLMENLLCLAFVASHLQGAHARQLRKRALRLLQRQLISQILPDGCHEERSPMYHSLIIERICDLLAVLPSAERPVAETLRATLRQMSAFLNSILHPDGDIPLLGDSTFAVAPAPSLLLARATALGAGPLANNQAFIEKDGHFVHRRAHPTDFLLFDAAPLGADYNGAHQHADLCGFEVSLGGRRVVSDGGAGIYREGAPRDQSRSSREHAVLTVDGLHVAEPWKSFRMGRRGHIIARTSRTFQGGVRMEATHDGFAPLGLIHRRTIEAWHHQRRYRITDCLEQEQPLPEAGALLDVIVRIPLHPDIHPELQGHAQVALSFLQGTPCATLSVECPLPSCDIRIESGLYYRAFGDPTPRKNIAIHLTMAAGMHIVYTLAAAP